MYLICAAGVAREPNRRLMFSSQLCLCYVCVRSRLLRNGIEHVNIHTYIQHVHDRLKRISFNIEICCSRRCRRRRRHNCARARRFANGVWLLLENACYACHIKCVYSFKRLGHIELPRAAFRRQMKLCVIVLCVWQTALAVSWSNYSLATTLHVFDFRRYNCNDVAHRYNMQCPCTAKGFVFHFPFIIQLEVSRAPWLGLVFGENQLQHGRT